MSASQEPIGLIYWGWDNGESGWKNQVDANWLKIGSVMQLAAKSRNVSAPPATPANGDRYIVGPSATGVWATKENRLAVYRSNIPGWEFYVPTNGWQCIIEDEISSGIVIWNGTAWRSRDEPGALTDAATITANFASSRNFTLTIGGNRTMGDPSNMKPGQSGTITITQDATGSRTLGYSSKWKFPAGAVPALTTSANAVDTLHYYVESATRISAKMWNDVK